MSSVFLENWATQLRKGFLELCILTVLNQERLYGYEIVKRLRLVEGLMIGEGTVYPILSRLKIEGLLDTFLESSPDGPPRKYYQMTHTGREYLVEMRKQWQMIKDGMDQLSTREGT